MMTGIMLDINFWWHLNIKPENVRRRQPRLERRVSMNLGMPLGNIGYYIKKPAKKLRKFAIWRIAVQNISDDLEDPYDQIMIMQGWWWRRLGGCVWLQWRRRDRSIWWRDGGRPDRLMLWWRNRRSRREAIILCTSAIISEGKLSVHFCTFFYSLHGCENFSSWNFYQNCFCPDHFYPSLSQSCQASQHIMNILEVDSLGSDWPHFSSSCQRAFFPHSGLSL